MNKVLSFLAILVSAVFIMLEFNLINSLNRFYDAVEFRAFLADDANRDSLKSVIRNYPGILEIRFISKDEALEEFNKNFKNSEYFLKNVSENPFPASFKISLVNHYKNPNYTMRLSSAISSLAGVARVSYSKDWIQTLYTINGYFKWLSIGSGVLLFCFLIFILIIGVSHQRIVFKDEIKVLRDFGIPGWKLKLKFGWQVFVWNIVFAGFSIGLVYCGYKFALVKYSIGTTIITSFLPLFFMLGFVGAIGVVTLILLFAYKI